MPIVCVRLVKTGDNVLGSGDLESWSLLFVPPGLKAYCVLWLVWSDWESYPVNRVMPCLLSESHTPHSVTLLPCKYARHEWRLAATKDIKQLTVD